MPNIKFTYFYRDAGNYKKWANVVFSNPNRLTLEAATEALTDAFLQDGLFIAHQVRVPEAFLFSRGNAISDDHCFHEFNAVTASSEDPNDPYSRSITEFIAEVGREAKSGWAAFDPHDGLPQRTVGRAGTLFDIPLYELSGRLPFGKRRRRDGR